MPGVLYLVATPIGNLEDVTLRALRVLREVDVVAAEDTRRVRALLDRHGIRNRVVSYHEHNERARVGELLALLRSGGSVALVSDAGTPVLSDPGYELVRACVDEGIPVVPVPGPSAVTAALVASGLPTDRFLFAGFPPRRRQARRRFLADLARLPATLVLFESPRRLSACLLDLQEVAGNRRVAVCRELTKRHEEVLRGTVQEVLARLGTAPVRGEVTLVVEGAVAPAAPQQDVEQVLREALAGGVSVREASEVAARRCGISRREAYRRALALSEGC
jgi:16S rRNA (cytidine1402-2'-O)-methyltransferase